LDSYDQATVSAGVLHRDIHLGLDLSRDDHLGKPKGKIRFI
jgi:hypothetical protein